MPTLTKADAEDPRFVACVGLIGDSGGRQFQIRYDDEQNPLVWVATAELRGGHQECAGGFSPVQAAFRLCETLYDGGFCGHCGQPAGVTMDWRAEMPLARVVCWWVYDPETEKFRRSCEGETKGRAFGMDGDGRIVRRNDPCPCGSGRKWKRCHGAG